jgi:hypothetical protein
MSLFKKETQKSVRVVLPLTLYNQIKDRCVDYGDLSRLVRHLLKQWIKNPKASIRHIYDQQALEDEVENEEAEETKN